MTAPRIQDVSDRINVPDTNRCIVRGRGQVLAVRRPRDIGQAFAMSAQVLDQFARKRVPDLDELVIRFLK
jgi:hypothetical protein